MNEVSKVTWEAEKDHPELCEKIRNGLRSVTDPEIGMDVIQLGLVRNVKIESDSALVTAVLTTPFCPYGPSMLESIREQAEKMIQLPTKVEYGSEIWDMSMMEGGGDGENDGFELGWFR